MSESNEKPVIEEPGNSIGRRILGWMQPQRKKQSGLLTIQVIANPSAGQGSPVLKILNTVFSEAKVEWDIAITKASGDGHILARRAIEAGADIIAVFGGDGTVIDVASALTGTPIPLGILPGGTANMMSRALGIPQDLAAAAELIAKYPQHRHAVFIGQVGDSFFAQMVGIGTEAKIVEGADRSAKDRLGNIAYTISALKAITDPTQALYRLEFDGGQVVEESGVTCLIAKTGNLGIPQLEASPQTADPNAPLMDIVIVRKSDIPTMVNIAATMVTGGINTASLPHWQASQVTVHTDPPQPIQADGELLGETPVVVRILPSPVSIIVPEETKIKKDKAAEDKPEG